MNASVAEIKKDQDVNNTVLIFGRVVASEPIKRNDGNEGYATAIDIPSEDQYGSKQTVEVISNKRLGNVLDEIKVPCKLGGYRRKMSGRDGRPDWMLTTMRLEAIQ